MLVCGGRDFSNKDLLYNTLYNLCWDREWKYGPEVDGNWLPNVTLIHGGARGADTLAEDWAVVNWCTVEEYKADWKTHGKRAGPIRNRQMLDEGKPDIVVAFPGGKGTADMVRRAQKANIEVIIVEEKV